MNINSFLKGLEDFLGKNQIILEKEGLSHFSYDATEQQFMPNVVVILENTEQVSKIMRLAYEHDVPITPRVEEQGFPEEHCLLRVVRCYLC
jgi:glycolate oxidase